MAERRIPPPSTDKVYNMLIFGDASIAKLVSPFRMENADTIKFFFVPTPEMRFKYQIQDEEYNRDTGVIEKEYPKNVCFHWSDYPITWGVLCDYRTTLIDNNFVAKINNTVKEQNIRYNQEIMTLKTLLARLSWDFQQIVRHPEEIDLRLIEKFEKLKKVVGVTQEIVSMPEEQNNSYEQR